jgi:hypothetical protein
LAATVHGSARLTQDVDIVYDRSPDNVERLVRALAPFEPYLRGAPRGLPFEWSAETVRHGLNFTLTTDAGDIDLFGEIAGGGDYSTVAENSVTVQLFDVDCLCLDLPALIATKRAAGRPRDLEVIAELEALREEGSGGGF